MINLQLKTNSLKIGSSVPSISLNYGRNLAKRPFAGSGKRNSCLFFVRGASGIYINVKRNKAGKFKIKDGADKRNGNMHVVNEIFNF